MILYLGLDPSRFPRQKKLVHFPVIRVEKILSSELAEAKRRWKEFTHVIFTSQTAVRFWCEEVTYRDVVAIAVGEVTAKALRQKGYSPLIAQEETQEGIIALLKAMDLSQAFLLWPKSKLARDKLGEFLSPFSSFVFDLYEPLPNRVDKPPMLTEVEEIVFTSPSTVQAFLALFGAFPADVKLTAIGPVTKAALIRMREEVVAKLRLEAVLPF